MDISVVVPLFNEAESLPELAAWIERVMKEHNFTYEVLMINDGSTDNSWSVIKELSEKNPCIKGVSFRRNYGKSPALYTGFDRVQGDVVITMDADLQDSPDEIPELYRMITEDGYDLVSGWKQKRYDPLSKTIPTKLFNATARKVSGIKNLHDFNCGLKAYRRDVVKHIEVYGDMHRYIPYLAKNAGFDKIGEKVVHHQARKYGKSKFGLDRFVNGYLDLMTLWFQSKFGVKPMHFFGLLGSLMFFIGLIAVIAVGAIKLYNMHAG
ncbi:MAG: glycosyltransferase family 2 protein, partial [Muribaculaceae bacterium]|nr:glycosyltransferase family 2 protein [Muribaculaceae bacterium]